MARERRKKNKLRGQRTHGAGNKKNHRGKGVRGGVGRAGSHKHKFSKYYVDFGVKKTLKPKRKKQAVNIEFLQSNIQRWASAGKARKEGDLTVVDGASLGFGKVLGRGSIKEKIRLENAKASAGAAKKIIKAGGVVQGHEGTEGADDEFEAEEKGEEAAEEENMARKTGQ